VKRHRDASVRKQVDHKGTKAQGFNELRAFVVNLLADSRQTVLMREDHHPRDR
jgi:hypothetical protein